MATKKKKSVSETGHNKNVANFSTAFQVLEEMGALYNPSNTNISLINLNPYKSELATVVNELNTKIPLYKNVVATRELKMKEMGKIITRSINFAKSVAISTTDKENLQSQVRKLRGTKTAKKINPNTAKTESISTAQLSYDSRIANLETYINQLASHNAYTPNEAELQIVSLQAYQQELGSLNIQVNASVNALITARKNRNAVLYDNEKNIIQLMREIKAYLKSLGEAAKPYYKAIVRLRFTDKQ
ncbi:MULTISPECIES: hypothetical protein [Flavobacterium]|uniref:Uncharacterized protein n=1 Tax=Flavobacterium jumunjinense TaxID=998845 RepID=A0ABV5GMB1_9FLAO|nr:MULTISPECIES: hypothetical protein [Flavobacterium]